MRYVRARIEDNDHSLAYRIYVTDSLKYIARLNVRYVDMIKKPIVETRSADEIKTHVSGMLKKLGES